MSDQVLAVDPTKCVGHALCHEVFPEMIALDDWGYPIISRGVVPRELLPLARRARSVCPALALRLERRPRAEPARSGGA